MARHSPLLAQRPAPLKSALHTPVRATVELPWAVDKRTHTKEPPMTPELIGILAVGATIIGLLVTFRRDARAEMAEVRSDLANLRKDLQALTERVSRLEGIIEGLFARRRDRDHHDDA